MRITKRQLKQIIKEELMVNELFGFGSKNKEKNQAALKDAQEAALAYIDKYQGLEVGPFLEKGSSNPNKSIDINWKWKKELHTKKYSREVAQSIEAQATDLQAIIDTWEQTSGGRADSDDAPFDIRALSQAAAMPGLYKDTHSDQQGTMESTIKLTKTKLRQIIKEELMVNELFGFGNSNKENHQTTNEKPITSIDTLGSGTINAIWSQDGLTMELHNNGSPVIKLGHQKDAKALISMLEELLTGPMRTI